MSSHMSKSYDGGYYGDYLNVSKKTEACFLYLNTFLVDKHCVKHIK